MSAVPQEMALEPIVGEVEDQAQNVALIATPQQMLATAVARGADLATLEKLMDLQDRWEAGQAKKAFNAALAAFHANPPEVFKNKRNAQYDSMYSTLDNTVNPVSLALAEHGLTVRWDLKQAGKIEVTCILTHTAGHSERVTLEGAADTSGAKNALQQVKSTITYLRGATFEAVTGTATSERVGVNRDDDGNGSGKRPQQHPQQPRGTKATPAGDVWERQTAETRAFLQIRADEAKQYLKAGDVAGAVDYLHSQHLDADETVAIWTRFDSADRTAMKKHRDKNPAPKGMTDGDREALARIPR